VTFDGFENRFENKKADTVANEWVILSCGSGREENNAGVLWSGEGMV
jgi:hypothetical protein